MIFPIMLLICCNTLLPLTGSRDFRQDLNMYKVFWYQALAEEQNLIVTTKKDNATGSLTVYSMLNTY